MVPQKELLCLKKRGQLNIRKRRSLFCSENLESPPLLLTHFRTFCPLPPLQTTKEKVQITADNLCQKRLGDLKESNDLITCMIVNTKRQNRPKDPKDLNDLNTCMSLKTKRQKRPKDPKDLNDLETCMILKTKKPKRPEYPKNLNDLKTCLILRLKDQKDRKTQKT